MTAANDDPYFKEGAMSGFVRGMNDPNFVREPYYGYSHVEMFDGLTCCI
jgi:hypothetical protein